MPFVLLVANIDLVFASSCYLLVRIEEREIFHFGINHYWERWSDIEARRCTMICGRKDGVDHVGCPVVSLLFVRGVTVLRQLFSCRIRDCHERICWGVIEAVPESNKHHQSTLVEKTLDDIARKITPTNVSWKNPSQRCPKSSPDRCWLRNIMNQCRPEKLSADICKKKALVDVDRK